MAKTWLSVIIPTYNGEAYLSSALASVATQDDRDIECLIIDDGSEDSTPSIINSFQEKLPITLIRQPRTGNWVHNTNQALCQAGADFACFLHQDDLWLRNKLSTMKRLIERYSKCNLFLHPSYYIDHEGRRQGLWRCPLPTHPRIVDADLLLERLLVQNFISIPAPIFKRELAIRLGGLDEGLLYTADWDFWLKLGAESKAIYHPEPLTSFRIHPASQTMRQGSNISDFRRQLESVLEKHLRANPSVDPAIVDVARFSVDVNVALATAMHEGKKEFWKLIMPFIRLGPAGGYRFIRDSRILERACARIKAGMS
jgi:glycosyltransferase involved in cell wall biosynthesis